MCSSYPAHKSTYLSASSSPIPTQLGTHHLPMYVDPPTLLSAVPKGCRNQNTDIHKHPLPGPISQKRVCRFSPFFAHRSFTILPTGVPIFSAKFRAHVSSNSLFHGSRSCHTTNAAKDTYTLEEQWDVFGINPDVKVRTRRSSPKYSIP